MTDSEKGCVARIIAGYTRLCAPAILGLALSGCASPGFPRPPSLHLPAPVTDLTATRIANRVELHWTAPTSTTDGLDLTIPTTVEICRDTAVTRPAPEPAQPSCTTVLKAAGHPSPSSAVDQLPGGLTDAQNLGRLLAYRVRIANPSGRAAPPTSVALVPAGPSPASVEGFRAIQQKDGVLLRWRPLAPQAASRPGPEASGSAAFAEVEVLRTDLTPKPPSPSVRSNSPSTGTSKPKALNPIAPRHRTDPSAEVRLRPDAATAPSSEGMIDQSALPTGTYTYRAQRVLAVSEGGKTFEILSDPTTPVTVAMHDTFPPEIPRGLASIPGTTDQPSGSGSRPTIDLSWQPNTELDLAGYLVYRTDLSASGGPLRITESPVPGPAFRDADILSGHRYEYRVTAVDRSGNESAQSAAIQDSPEGR